MCFICQDTGKIYTPAQVFITWMSEDGMYLDLKENKNSEWMNERACPICNEDGDDNITITLEEYE